MLISTSKKLSKYLIDWFSLVVFKLFWFSFIFLLYNFSFIYCFKINTIDYKGISKNSEYYYEK